MRKELKELQEIIKELSTRSDWEKNIRTLTFVANMLNENYNEHLTTAMVRREIIHNRLRVIVDFRPVQPEPEEVKNCLDKRVVKKKK